MVSDALDGQIARRFPSQQSALGTALDPLADKVTMVAVYSAFYMSNTIPAWFFYLIISRDVALVAATALIRYQTLPKPKTLNRYFDFGLVSVKLNPTWISKVIFPTGVQILECTHLNVYYQGWEPWNLLESIHLNAWAF